MGVVGALAIGVGAAWHFLAPHSGATSGAAEAVPKGELTLADGSSTIDAAVFAKAASPPEGYVEYRNARYGFSLYHEPGATAAEYDEGGGAMTVVLENIKDPSQARGMQIFVVPYSGTTISEERFHKDAPSGVRENVEATTVDGVEAVTFNGYDSFLGDTREVWVIHGGYLYEITTFKGVGNWFTPIIQSWRFL